VWSGPAPDVPTECLVQVRAHGEPVPATAWCDGGSLVVELAEPLRGVAPGQAVVLYDGDAVLGSATIDATSDTTSSVRAS
jgi:tRNA-specific 2-thiouridylase